MSFSLCWTYIIIQLNLSIRRKRKKVVVDFLPKIGRSRPYQKRLKLFPSKLYFRHKSDVFIYGTKMRNSGFLLLLSLVLNCFPLNYISDTKMRNWGFLLLLSLVLSCSASPPWLTKQYKGVAHPHRRSCPRHRRRHHHQHLPHHHRHSHCPLHFDTRPNFDQKMGEVWARQV